MQGTSILDNLNRDVYIATSSFKGELGGQVITWVTHASLVEDKRNVVSVFSKFNHTYKLISQSGSFVLQLPAQDQVSLAATFGLTSGNDRNKFTSDINFHLKKGHPIFAHTCGFSIQRVLKEVDLGDRMIVVSRVEEEVIDQSKKPLNLKSFLESLTPEQSEKQKENYLKMAERDSFFII